MFHRLYWKPSICIVVTICSFLFYSSPHSAVAFRLKGPRRFFPKLQYCSVQSGRLLSVATPLQSLKIVREDGRDKDFDMIVRVRSNLGTVKLKIGDDERATEATIRTRILEDLQNKTSTAYQMTQELSFDPAGTRKIHPSKLLSEQGIQHGSMVYCRVEEAASKDSDKSDGNKDEGVDNKNISANNAKLKEEPKETLAERDVPKKNNCVIDLIESSDEEETSDENDDDDDEVQVISPPKRQKSISKTRAEDPIPTNRKRPRASSNSDSSAKKVTVRYNTMTGGSYPNFQIASYNVWFGPPDPEARQVYPQERMKGIVECLELASSFKERQQGMPCPLLFVGLQELTPNLVEYLEPSFQSMGYKLYTQTIGGSGPSYGIGIVVPKDLTIIEHGFLPYKNSIQGRGFFFVRTPTLLFATTHLESWCGPQMTGAKEREVQIVEVANYCQEQLVKYHLELTAILGDLNWDDERKRKSSEAPNRNLLSILPNGWQDAGKPFDFTYDAKENPMLGGNLRRRFDRCLYRTNFKSYSAKGLEKIGSQSIPNLIWNKRNTYNNTVKKMPVAPSDHFGILIHFSKKGSS